MKTSRAKGFDEEKNVLPFRGKGGGRAECIFFFMADPLYRSVLLIVDGRSEQLVEFSTVLLTLLKELCSLGNTKIKNK